MGRNRKQNNGRRAGRPVALMVSIPLEEYSRLKIMEGRMEAIQNMDMESICMADVRSILGIKEVRL